MTCRPARVESTFSSPFANRTAAPGARHGPLVNPFKHALREGRTLFGAWLMSGSPATAEALGVAGFDFLVVDMEHTPVETHQMIDILRAIAGTPAAGDRPHAVERHGDDQARARRRRADDADAFRAERRRGAARGGVHALSARTAFAASPACIAATATAPCPTTSSRASERAVRDGADRDALGARAPAGDRRRPRHRLDLHRTLGSFGVDGSRWATSANAAVQDTLRGAAARCRELGKPSGILGANPELVAKYVEYGYSWIAIGSDMAFMMGRAQEWLAKARASRA